MSEFVSTMDEVIEAWAQLEEGLRLIGEGRKIEAAALKKFWEILNPQNYLQKPLSVDDRVMLVDALIKIWYKRKVTNRERREQMLAFLQELKQTRKILEEKK